MKRALLYIALIPPLLVALAWLVWSSQIPFSDAAPPNAECVHVVKRGDTLGQIAQRYNTTVAALADANRIANPNLIHVGNKIRIPNCGTTQSAAPTQAARPTATPTSQPTPASPYVVDILERQPRPPAYLDTGPENAARGATVQILVGTRLSLNVGTGTVVGTDGRTILTAFHLVGDEDTGTPYPAIEILVGPFKGYTLRAHVIATDPDNDLAVLHVDRRPDFTGFAFLPLADSDATPLGEPVYLLSYPLRPEGGLAVTRGNLLGIVRERASGQRVGFITDASVSPGSSGGVAINAHGEVLGIITQGFFPTLDMGRPDLPPVSRLTGIVPINVARPTLNRATGQ